MPKKRKHPVRADARLNAALQEQVQSLRGGMVGAAEKVVLPPRFTVQADTDSPAFFLTDAATGRVAHVNLCDYFGVRKALRDLFG